MCLALLVISCGGPVGDNSTHRDTYAQPTILNEAVIMQERNDAPHAMASSSQLYQKGVLVSAKHITDREDDNTFKVFFNGRAYRGTFMKTPPLSDLVLVQIEGLDPATTPEPYTLGPAAQVGDRVFVRGIHPHPPNLQKERTIVPIFSGYYGLKGRKDEFVFDNLPARVVNTNVVVDMGNIKGAERWLEGTQNVYTELRTDDDHLFSFAGLSGGPILNERGQIVGVVATEQPDFRLESPNSPFLKQEFHKINIVPVSELRALLATLPPSR